MNIEKFNDARAIQEEIKTRKIKLSECQRFMNCCNLKAEVTGTVKGGFNQSRCFLFNHETLKSMLPIEEARLIKEIEALEVKFQKL